MKEHVQIPLPEAFLKKMKGLLAEEYQAFIDSYEKEKAAGLRFNPLKWNGEREKLKFGLREIPWAGEGYYYEADTRPGKHPLHEAGAYYIQEPSAMAVVELLAPKPEEKVLDLCAAPGGKTTQIAGRMNQMGLLVSNEIHPARAKILSQNVERMGIGNAVVTNEDSKTLLARFPEFFDKILVDAPCSGEGMFRKDEQARKEWSPENVILCGRRQAEILDHAAGMLKDGGRLVYSTCTFSPEENEGSIQNFLNRHKDFVIEDVMGEAETSAGFSMFGHGRPEWIENGNPELSKTFRIWPHQTEGEGHFLAVLRKKEEQVSNLMKENPVWESPESFIEEEYTKKRYKKAGGRAGRDRKGEDKAAEILEIWHRFMEMELLSCSLDKARLILFGDQLYAIPSEMTDIKGLKVLRPGLHLGEFKKNRFEPSHSLALYLKKEQVKQWVSLDGDGILIQRYLGGETIDTGCLAGVHKSLLEKGWVLMLVDDCSVGWAKLTGNTLKNHYPKGLEILGQ